MRIWSLHPRYLDAKGLVAAWRETLLAKYVLEGKTKGYKHHPQLDRFKRANSPTDAINRYLAEIYRNAAARGYKFDSSKFDPDCNPAPLTVTNGQLAYETQHLLQKLRVRDPERYREFLLVRDVEPHPLFCIVEGGVEEWEIVGTPAN